MTHSPSADQRSNTKRAQHGCRRLGNGDEANRINSPAVIVVGRLGEANLIDGRFEGPAYEFPRFVPCGGGNGEGELAGDLWV